LTSAAKPVSQTRTPLREYLDGRGIRYGWVAEKLGVSAATMTKLMNGTQSISVLHDRALCQLFEEPVGTFLPAEAAPNG